MSSNAIQLSYVPRFVIGVHAVASAWILLNGAGHQLHVLWKAWRGTLAKPEELGALLWIGAGLLLAASLMTGTLGLLARPGRVLPAVLSVFVLLGVLSLTWLHYGPRFLTGSFTIAFADLIALSVAALGLTRATL